MQAFEVLSLRWFLVMLLGGVGLAVALFLGFYLAGRAAPHPPQEDELEEFAADIKVDRKPIPPILVLVYLGFGIFMLSYVLFIWLAGVRY